MFHDTQQALQILDSRQLTCVVCRENLVYTATERGVKPLLSWLDNGPSLVGFCAADRVVGRGAAFLYCLLGVREVYAHVMSRPAAQVLQAHGISYHAGSLVDGIINRKGTGPCPFEEAVMDIQDAHAALASIRRKLSQL
jgi:hypothetical protein